MNENSFLKTDINQYLINEINIEIYNKITNSGFNPNPLDFFFILYSDFHFFCNNSNNYLILHSYFDTSKFIKENGLLNFDFYRYTGEDYAEQLNIAVNQLNFYESLQLLINEKYPIENRNEVLKQSIKLIDKAIEKYSFCLEYLFSFTNNENLIESFQDLQEYLECINDIDERIEVVLRIKYKYLENKDLFIVDENDTSFVEKCNFEIQRLIEYGKILSNEKFILEIKNPKHENIFCNNGFELFNHILKEYVKPTKGRQSDLIFYHRKMYDYKPQYIHKRPTEFFKWFEDNYDEVFGQLKTLSQVETPQRNKDFSNALDWFKQQSQQVP